MKQRLNSMLIILLSATLMSGLYAMDTKTLLVKGLESLGAKKGSPELCVITDATYIRMGGKTCESWVDLLQEETGCSIGKGNLLFVHRPADYPLIIALFRKDTKECVFIRDDGEKATSTKQKFEIGGFTDQARWDKVQKALGADAFSLVAIANAWAAGAPYDFLRCAEFHNHICPGMTSGYFLAGFIMKNYPLNTGDRYIFIACPEWCKDDALQILLDATPGKRSYYVKGLTSDQLKSLENRSVAGILVITRRKEAGRKAVILGYDWNKANEMAGGESYEGLAGKMQLIIDLISHLDKPEQCVSVLKEIEISDETLSRLKTAGVNPYEELGFVKEQSK